jgi:hypothetical protein
MKKYYQLQKMIAVTIVCIACALPFNTYAQDSVTGKKFKTLIYDPNVDKASTTITFDENNALLIDMYEGFGVYAPLGPAFVSFFSAPKYNKEDDLVLLMSGVVVADFLSGIGISLQNFQFAGIFMFFGYGIT